MTTPDPSGCSITGDTAARTAAALLTADPPEIARAREALAKAHDYGQSHVILDLPTADDLLGTVDYLRGQLAAIRLPRRTYAEQVAEQREICRTEGHTPWPDGPVAGLLMTSALCSRCGDPLPARPPGGEG